MAHVRRFVLLSGVVVVTLLAGSAGAIGDDSEKVVVAVHTDKKLYQRGEPVQIGLITTNPLGTELEVTYGCSCCIFELAIETPAQVEVARFTRDWECPMVGMRSTLAGYLTVYTAYLQWHQRSGDFGVDDTTGALVAPGTYRANIRHLFQQWYSEPFVICDDECTATSLYYLPAAAYQHGTSAWRSDLEVLNLGGGDALISVSLLEHGRDNSSPQTTTVVVEDGATYRVENALWELFGFAGTAALRFEVAGAEVSIGSYTYWSEPGSTYGQSIPAIPATAGMISAVVPQLRYDAPRTTTANGSYRSNLGLVNLTAWAVTLTVELHTGSSGEPRTMTVPLAPFEYRQLNNPLATVAEGQVRGGFARISPAEGEWGAFLAYGSVVNNDTQDPVYIPAVRTTWQELPALNW